VQFELYSKDAVVSWLVGNNVPVGGDHINIYSSTTWVHFIRIKLLVWCSLHIRRSKRSFHLYTCTHVK